MAQSENESLARARRIARQRLESLSRAGVEVIPRHRVDPTRPLAPPPAVEEPPLPSAIKEEVTMPPVNVVLGPFATLEERVAALEVIQREVKDCPRCPVLVQERTQTVFGVGNPMTPVCFFGEAPGADEDRQGEPFVGRAGQLLDKIIEACTFTRESVYILNVLKCRPPENRRPEPGEIENCRGYFERQLQVIRPTHIVCLGVTAAQTLLNSTVSIGKLRGTIHTYRIADDHTARVIATYHPAYLLRNPAAKADVWADMKMLLADMGIELPGKK